MAGVALAVAAIPEGLATIVTTALASAPAAWQAGVPSSAGSRRSKRWTRPV